MCGSDPDELSGLGDSAPADAQAARDVAAVRDRLAAIRALDTAGKHATAAQEIDGAAADAVAHHRQALAIRRRTGPPSHIAAGLNNLGNALLDLREFDEARAVLTEAHARFEEAFGTGHPQVALALNNLGTLYFDTGELEAAERVTRRTPALAGSLVRRGGPSLSRESTGWGMTTRRNARPRCCAHYMSAGVHRSADRPRWRGRRLR